MALFAPTCRIGRGLMGNGVRSQASNRYGTNSRNIVTHKIGFFQQSCLFPIRQPPFFHAPSFVTEYYSCLAIFKPRSVASSLEYYRHFNSIISSYIVGILSKAFRNVHHSRNSLFKADRQKLKLNYKIQYTPLSYMCKTFSTDTEGDRP